MVRKVGFVLTPEPVAPGKSGETYATNWLISTVRAATLAPRGDAVSRERCTRVTSRPDRISPLFAPTKGP